MPQCPHCNHEFAISEGFACPACGADYRQAPSASAKPAHLAVLEAGGPPELPAETPEAKPRLVSSAGPAVPVMKQQNDSVPSGWMARLEAARMVASNSGGVETQPTAPKSSPPPPGPPPLKKSKKKKKEDLSNKPAHLLVAELESEETRRRTEEAARIEQLFTTENADEISSVQVEVPVEARTKKKIPDWVIGVVILAVVAVGGYFAYNSVKKAPEVKAEVNPELKKNLEKRKKAVAALEQGHTKLLEGEKGAKEAIELYKKALELEPTLASAERGLGSAYAALHDKAKAAEHYRRYLELKPKAKDAADVRAIVEKYEKSKKK